MSDPYYEMEQEARLGWARANEAESEAKKLRARVRELEAELEICHADHERHKAEVAARDARRNELVRAIDEMEGPYRKAVARLARYDAWLASIHQTTILEVLPGKQGDELIELDRLRNEAAGRGVKP